MSAVKTGYFRNLALGIKSILDGMSVTLSHLVRKPMTIQYPDRIPVPVTEMLPERYRGFLEVEMGICTACLACERACPIECIRIEMEGKGKERLLSRFDIDMAKCMYCGLCVEPCPTNAIRMTKEFEGATTDLSTLIFRFVPPGGRLVPFKPKKGEDPPTMEKGVVAREALALAREHNPTWIAVARAKQGATTAEPAPPAAAASEAAGSEAP